MMVFDFFFPEFWLFNIEHNGLEYLDLEFAS